MIKTVSIAKTESLFESCYLTQVGEDDGEGDVV